MMIMSGSGGQGGNVSGYGTADNGVALCPGAGAAGLCVRDCSDHIKVASCLLAKAFAVCAPSESVLYQRQPRDNRSALTKSWQSCGRGMLIKGGKVVDALAACQTIAFDKTGTLTTGALTCTGLTAPNGTAFSGATANREVSGKHGCSSHAGLTLPPSSFLHGSICHLSTMAVAEYLKSAPLAAAPLQHERG